MPFNFNSPEYLSHHGTRKNQVSLVSRASPAHIISPLEVKDEWSDHYFMSGRHENKAIGRNAINGKVNYLQISVNHILFM